MSQDNGYCLAYRRAWNHDSFVDLLEASIWNFLYQNAFYQDGERTFNGNIFYLKRGQIVVTPRFLAKGFRISESNARRVIQKLIKLKSIETQTTTKATIITICNYDKYQLPVKTNDDQSDDQTENRTKTDDANNNKITKQLNNKNNENKSIINKIDLKPPNVSEQTWEAFKKLRAAKKSPITDIVITRILGEADKAFVSLEEALQECCERGWTSFKADWYNKSNINLTRGIQHGQNNDHDLKKGIITGIFEANK